MPRPATRKGSSHAQFRLRTPADVRDLARGHKVCISFPAMDPDRAATVEATIGNEITFSLRSSTQGVVKARHAMALTHLNLLFRRLREGPTSLTLQQCVAISGEIYRTFIDRFGADPFPAETWAAIKGQNRAARQGRNLGWVDRLDLDVDREAVAIAAAALGPDLTTAIDQIPTDVDKVPQLLEERFGHLADHLLATRGLVIDAASRLKLLREVDRAATDALLRLKRHAIGDYTPDPMALRFPTEEDVKPAAPIHTGAVAPAPATSWEALLSRWEKEHAARQGSPKTQAEWRQVMERFIRFCGKADPNQVTAEDVDAWKDHLLEQGLSATTVAGRDLACLRTIFAAGARGPKKLVASNPAQEVRLHGARRAAKKMRGFSDEIAAAVLAAARRETDPARRWVPWLIAFSGSRLGEILQLRAKDVLVVNGHYCLDITDEAGRKKTRSALRQVPIHPTILDDGFLAFVEAKAELGPDTRLFLVGGRNETVTPRGMANQLRCWVHSLALPIGDHVQVEPFHAWRHWLKSKALECDIDGRIIDAIVGHAPRSVGQAYGEVSIAVMARALNKIPVPG